MRFSAQDDGSLKLRKAPAKKLPLMKLFPNFYVFIYEDEAKLYVAETHHDHQCLKTTAYS